MDEKQSNKRRRSDEPSRILLRITDLPDVLIKLCLAFVGPGHYRFVAGTCQQFQKQYSFPKETSQNCMAGSVSCARFMLEDSALLADPKEKDEVLGMLHRGASRTGNVQVLQWALDEYDSKASFEELSLAASGGHVKVLEWADKNGIQWLSYKLCERAAYHGQVDMLDWIYERVCHDKRSFHSASPSAFHGGHIPVLEWLHDRNLLLSYPRTHEAAGRGQLAVLQWMNDKGRLDTNDGLAWSSAAHYGDVKLLQWLFENGFASTIGFLNKADIRDLSVLEWANDHGMEWTVEACKNAATYGNLDTLRWLRDHECPWDSDTIKYALIYNYRYVAFWARDNGCPEPPIVYGL